MKDIETKKDIKLMVDSFYNKVKNDDVIGFIFNDVAKVNWDSHLPIMYKFWEGVILNNGAYKGNALEKHIKLNTSIHLTKVHFDRWLNLFNSSIDCLFQGKNTIITKQRAQSIATMILIKLSK